MAAIAVVVDHLGEVVLLTAVEVVTVVEAQAAAAALPTVEDLLVVEDRPEVGNLGFN